jgi:hypothetical protein
VVMANNIDEVEIDNLGIGGATVTAGRKKAP